MKISTSLGHLSDNQHLIREVPEWERAGLDALMVPESYRLDAVSLMGYLAATTKRLEIGSGILSIYSRTPALLAMTAAGVDSLTQGRAFLGLGASGPQVIESFHGVPYDAPLTRTREIIEICRTIWRHEPLDFHGKKFHAPMPEGAGTTPSGRPLKLMTKPLRDDIPVLIASLTPKSVEMTAEIADGWLPILFSPKHVSKVWGASLASGKAKRGADRGVLDIYGGGHLAIQGDLDQAHAQARAHAALYIGGMGSRELNFYNDLFASYGYEDEAPIVQDLFLSRKRGEAAAAIPQNFIDQTNLIGPPEFVRDRLAELREAGVTYVNVILCGETAAERMGNIETLRNLIDAS